MDWGKAKILGNPFAVKHMFRVLGVNTPSNVIKTYHCYLNVSTSARVGSSIGVNSESLMRLFLHIPCTAT